MTQTSPVEQLTSNNVVLEDSIEVPAPVNDVYRRWSDLPRFPEFMASVEEVQPRGGNRYHWVARMFGVKQEWDAEVTEYDPLRRISWRSVTGPFNSGIITFTSLGSAKTLLRLRYEFAPPGGMMGQALPQLTQTRRHEIHEDLLNFKKLYTGGTPLRSFGEEVAPGLSKVLGPLTVPLAASAAGGVASYIVGKRMRESRTYTSAISPIALPNAVAGWALTGAAAVGMLGSAVLRARGRLSNALFLGQWAPTLLSTGTFARLMGHRGMQTTLPTSVTSWTCASASLAATVTSAFLHARGRREDGIYVGQWAPTFMNAAVSARLFNRLLAR